MSQRLTNKEKSCTIREQFLRQTDILCEILDRRPIKHEPESKPAMDEWFRLLEEDKEQTWKDRV